MKIELKNVKINLTFSEETIMFKADVVINGVVAGEAENDGRGGSTFYSAKTYDVKKQQFLSDAERQRNKELVKQAEEFCKTLPPIRVEEYDFEYDMTLEHFIDNLIDEELNKKEQKKLEKKMETTIMWGKPKGNSYMQVKFKVPLAKIPLAQLQGFVDKYKKEFKAGDVFLNTNLESLGVKL
jgi:hypothetical protein